MSGSAGFTRPVFFFRRTPFVCFRFLIDIKQYGIVAKSADKVHPQRSYRFDYF